MDTTDLRRVQARLGSLPRGEQAAVSLAIAEALGPLAELGEQVVASVDVARLLSDARSAIESVSLVALRQLLAEAEAIPVVAAREEPPDNAVFAVDVLACLVYAIKTMIEPEPALWSGYCVQRAYDCLFFADEALARSGGPAGLMQALDAWLDGDAGDQLRRESVSLALLLAQLRRLNDRLRASPGAYGGSGSRASPVWARKPSMRAGLGRDSPMYCSDLAVALWCGPTAGGRWGQLGLTRPRTGFERRDHLGSASAQQSRIART